MGLITSCFHGSSENDTGELCAPSGTFSPLALSEARGAPNVTGGKSSIANGHICKTRASLYHTKDLSESVLGHFRDVSAGEFRSGFERALALQALLCATGPSDTVPEARARCLVESVLNFLNASSVRLYITGSSFSNSGSSNGVEGRLVQLAAATARTHNANENPSAEFPSCPSYFCPRHEAAGAASMLLRRALVSKVPVVHRCEPKSDPTCSRTPLSSTPAPFSPTISGRESAESATVATAARCVPLRAVTTSNSSTYSQSPQPEHPPAQPHDRSRTGAAAGCCPDLDLCEHDAVPGSPMLFAAIPIMCGASALGVLWLATPAAPASNTPSGSAEQDPRMGPLGSELSSVLIIQRGDTALPISTSVANTVDDTSQISPGAAAATASGRSRSHPTPAAELLSDPATLQHLALSVSMSLAAGHSNLPHMCRLAGSMHQLAASSSLAELIGELCSLLSNHVRRRFLADVVVQAALVPGADSRVAFMLRSERAETPTGSGPRSASMRRMVSQSRLRVTSMCAPSATPEPSGFISSTVSGGVGRSRSVTYTPPSAMGKRPKTSMPDLQRGYTSVAGPTEGTAPVLRPASLTTPRGSGARDVFMLESAAPRCDGLSGAASCAHSTLNQHHPPSLSARAFRLSNTLLHAMLQPSTNSPQQQRTSVLTAAARQEGAEAGEAAGRNNGVLPGLLVCDCARHIQDEHQPSRDVCMLMMAAGSAGGGGGGTQDGGRLTGYGVSNAVLNAHSNSTAAQEASVPAAGAQALVLLGMETGEGAVLALYLAFPTPAPQQLLACVRDSCSALMSEHLVDLVRHRLAFQDLAAEWETLRAGVPGAYVSVSRCSTTTGPDNSANPAAAVGTVNLSVAGSSCGAMVPLSPLSRQTTRCTMMLSDPAFSAEDAACLLAAGGSSSTPRHAPQSRDSRRSVLSCVPIGSAPVPPTVGMVDLGATLAASSDAGSAPAPVIGGGKNPSQSGHKNGPSPLAGSSRKMSVTAAGMVVEEAGGQAAGGNWLIRSRRSVTNAASPVIAPSTSASRTSSARGMIARLGRALERDNGVPMQTSLDSNVITPAMGSVGGGGSRRPHSGTVIRSAMRNAYGSTMGDEDSADWLGVDVTAAAIVSGGRAVGVSTGAAALLTVHDLDETYESWGMRAHMGALVESIMSTTLRNSGAHVMDDAGPGGEAAAAARIVEGLEELQLVAVLGQGASGVVLRGTLGCTPVAVKIMEMPDGDVSVRGKPGTDSGEGAGHRSKEPDDGEGEAAGTQQTGGKPSDGELREVRARRALLRNAMEVALMRTISHVNIVQAFGVYDNVVMERHEGRQGVISLRRVNLKETADTKIAEGVAGPPDGTSTKTSSPICTAIVLELCDRGSLADVLYSRTFPPLPLPPPHPSTSAAATAGMVMQYARYWKGVYMTLLEIALALRHLHSRHLVHRDLKPGNVLLKSSPGDPRGWTCKLADFGFAMVLDRVGSQTLDETQSALRSAALASSATQAGAASATVPSPGGREHFTVQQHVGGTVTHMAPEAFRKGARIDTGVDIFSFGTIMWELVCSRGQRPYRELALDAIGDAIGSGTRPLFPTCDHVTSAYRQLAKSCWAHEPRQRPSASELVNVIKGLLETVKS